VGAAPDSAPAPESGPTAAQRETVEQQLREAQQRLDESVREVERLSAQLGAHVSNRLMRVRVDPPPRAMLGVQVGPGEGGAKVMAVSPGGPAEAAGIKENDLIVAIAGKDLAKADDPGRELVEVMRAQEPDRKVKVRVKHDGKTRDVEVELRAPPRFMGFAGRPGGPPDIRPFGRGMDLRIPDPRGPNVEWVDSGRGGVPLAGMELATMSESLGKYFGAKEGVLVVRAGSNDAFKLQDGDVILKIDGREPNSASHATRILRSYQRGEKLQMTLLRDHKTQTLSVTLPGG